MSDGTARPPAIVVSACLLGVRCNHRGEASTSEAVVALGATHRLVPICPETAGGLPTPRAAAELQPGGRVVNVDGDDVTAAYERGAAAAMRLAATTGAREAILKARSPSCGCREIHDGTFTRTRRQGEGVTARALRDAGLVLRTEEEVEAAPPNRT